jgi:hypothetical protein
MKSERPWRIRNVAGQRFGRLTAVNFSHIGANGQAVWNCICDCGGSIALKSTILLCGLSTNCGCLHRHGARGTRLYRIWGHMIDRCGNPNMHAFHRYGGRGIRVCSEWRNDFPAFRFWALSHGYSDSLTIDRIDADGNYEPKNCQWLNRSEHSKKSIRDTRARATA